MMAIKFSTANIQYEESTINQTRFNLPHHMRISQNNPIPLNPPSPRRGRGKFFERGWRPSQYMSTILVLLFASDLASEALFPIMGY
jgi:hypothetical protein